MFIIITIVSVLTYIYEFLNKRHDNLIFLFFICYPVYNQTTHYLNLSSPIFIISPALIIMSLIYFLGEKEKFSGIVWLFTLLCFSTSLSVFNSANFELSFTFFVLAVGIFYLVTIVLYNYVKGHSDPLGFIINLVSSIFIGMGIYLTMEFLTFGVSIADLYNILLRNWDKVSFRYFTAGYKEPNGFGLVSAYLLPIILYYFDKRYFIFEGARGRHIIVGLTILGLFLLLLSGSRGAIISFINVIVFLLLFGKRIVPLKKFRLNVKKYALILSPVFALIFSILIFRTFIKSEDVLNTKTQAIGIGTQQIELIGTTVDYLRHTMVSFENLVNLPLGTGPLSLAPSSEEYSGGLYSQFSLLSNFFVVGSIFGWLTLAIWLTLVILITRKAMKLISQISHAGENKLTGLLLILLAIVWGSFFPASFYLGPLLNWSTFSYGYPIISDFGVPSEYPSIVAGVVYGLVLGLIENLKRQIPLPSDKN